jgi:flagellar basal body-associated protein FliL
MRATKQQKLRKRILIIVVAVIIISMAFAYVIPLKAMAVETPPPSGYGTDWGYDESTLPAPWSEEEEEEEKPPPELTISNTNIRLDIGQQMQLDVIMKNFPEGTIPEWRSENPEVAGVDMSGKVVAYAQGSTAIIVTAEGMRASVLVTVNQLKANKITILVGEDVAQLDPKSYELKVGDVIRLTAKIEPEGAKVEKITWSLGNSGVASIEPNSQTCSFVAGSVGKTQVSVTADGHVDAISFEIKESGVPIDTLWDYIRYGIVIVVVIVVLAVLLTWMSQKRKKEKARQKAAAAKRRREEAERRAREEATETEMLKDLREQNPMRFEERATLKISGAVVGAGIAEPKDEEGPDRPVTLDDLN